MRGAIDDIATSRAFIPPWSLADALEARFEGKTGPLSDQASPMKQGDRNPSDPEDDANCFAPLAGHLSENCARPVSVTQSHAERRCERDGPIARDALQR